MQTHCQSPAAVVEDISLGGRIRRALTHHIGFAGSDIDIQKNKVKYFNPVNPLSPDAKLEEVFGLMRGLNRAALADPHLCRNGGGGHSFSEALSDAADAAAVRFAGREIHYVELGPEPTKTTFILRRLIERGVRISSYVGVDINPASVAAMRKDLAAILGPEKTRYRVTPFERFRVDDVRDGATPALVTMLGFQEGNEDPLTASAWLQRVAGPGDIVLAEMQVMPETGSEAVMKFYRHPLMVRFSRLAFERARGLTPSLGRVFVLPVPVSDGQTIEAAIMCEEYAAGDRHRLFVSNYCLKYRLEQYRRHREREGRFGVCHEALTDDRSVLFQLACRA